HSVRAQPAGFGEFGSGAFRLARKAVRSSEIAPNHRMSWRGCAPFEPDNGLVRVPLQQIHIADLLGPNAGLRVTRTEPDGSLDARDRLIYRAPAQAGAHFSCGTRPPKTLAPHCHH